MVDEAGNESSVTHSYCFFTCAFFSVSVPFFDLDHPARLTIPPIRHSFNSFAQVDMRSFENEDRILMPCVWLGMNAMSVPTAT
jgi:hypothetical protein